MKEIRIVMTDEMHKALKESKGHLTWKEVLIEGVMGIDTNTTTVKKSRGK